MTPEHELEIGDPSDGPAVAYAFANIEWDLSDDDKPLSAAKKNKILAKLPASGRCTVFGEVDDPAEAICNLLTNSHGWTICDIEVAPA